MIPLQLVSSITRRLPARPASQLFVTAFNLSVWRKLRELDWRDLYGKRFCVAIRDLQLNLYFSVSAEGLRAQHPGPADVTFSASLEDFIRLALRLEDPDTLFFNRRLLIEGETDSGLQVKNMLDGIEFETLLDSFPPPIARMILYIRSRTVS